MVAIHHRHAEADRHRVLAGQPRKRIGEVGVARLKGAVGEHDDSEIALQRRVADIALVRGRHPHHVVHDLLVGVIAVGEDFFPQQVVFLLGHVVMPGMVHVLMAHRLVVHLLRLRHADNKQCAKDNGKSTRVSWVHVSTPLEKADSHERIPKHSTAAAGTFQFCMLEISRSPNSLHLTLVAPSMRR